MRLGVKHKLARFSSVLRSPEAAATAGLRLGRGCYCLKTCQFLQSLMFDWEQPEPH